MLAYIAGARKNVNVVVAQRGEIDLPEPEDCRQHDDQSECPDSPCVKPTT
jgi:hypothetical protein